MSTDAAPYRNSGYDSPLTNALKSKFPRTAHTPPSGRNPRFKTFTVKVRPRANRWECNLDKRDEAELNRLSAEMGANRHVVLKHLIAQNRDGLAAALIHHVRRHTAETQRQIAIAQRATNTQARAAALAEAMARQQEIEAVLKVRPARYASEAA